MTTATAPAPTTTAAPPLKTHKPRPNYWLSVIAIVVSFVGHPWLLQSAM